MYKKTNYKIQNRTYQCESNAEGNHVYDYIGNKFQPGMYIQRLTMQMLVYFLGGNFYFLFYNVIILK